MENAENFEGFKRFLRNKEIYFEEDVNDGARLVVMHQRIANSIELTMIVDFSNNNSVVSILIGDIAHIDSPLKKEELLKLINELNIEYNFMKFFVLDNGSVRANINLFVHDETDYDDIVMSIIVTVKAIEDEAYKKLMRLQWS